MGSDEILRADDMILDNRQNLVDNGSERVERRLDGIPPADGHIAMQDLLEDLGIGDEPLPLAYQPFKQAQSL